MLSKSIQRSPISIKMSPENISISHRLTTSKTSRDRNEVREQYYRSYQLLNRINEDQRYLRKIRAVVQKCDNYHVEIPSK